MNTIPEPELPKGYYFVYQNDLAPNEIIELRKKNSWDGDTHTRWQDCLKQSLAVVGVRNPEGVLSGMGCLVGNVRHAVLCDLVVNTEDRGKGLGKALLYERMQIAEKLNITYMYTDLSDVNPLRTKYDELGFINTGHGLFRDRKRLTQ